MRLGLWRPRALFGRGHPRPLRRPSVGWLRVDCLLLPASRRRVPRRTFVTSSCWVRCMAARAVPPAYSDVVSSAHQGPRGELDGQDGRSSPMSPSRRGWRCWRVSCPPQCRLPSRAKPGAAFDMPTAAVEASYDLEAALLARRLF